MWFSYPVPVVYSITVILERKKRRVVPSLLGPIPCFNPKAVSNFLTEQVTLLCHLSDLLLVLA